MEHLQNFLKYANSSILTYDDDNDDDDDDNFNCSTYHRRSHGVSESSNLTITVKLLSYVKQARSRYFNNQKERFTQRVQSGRNDKMKQINDDIDDANRNIRQQQDTRNSPKTSVDKYASEAEGKSTIAEIKNLISKSNALKRAATKKKKSAIFPC